MKFEKPIMNISMFEVENVVTSSGETTSYTQTDLAEVLKTEHTAGTTVVEFTF